jgi:hypothetical protein
VCWTPPTIAGGRLLARNNRGTLVCRDHRAIGRAAAGAPAVTRAAAELPAAEALFARHVAAIGGAGAPGKHPHVRMRGTYEQRSVGFVPVPFEILFSAPDRRRVWIQLPPPLDERFARDGVPGHLARVHDGEEVFVLNRYRGDKLETGGEAREERVAARLFAATDWRALHARAETRSRVAFDERPCYAVEATTVDGARRTLYFEVESGLLAGREAVDEALVLYRDYRAFEGWMLPTWQRVFRPEGGLEELFRVESVDFGPVPEQSFARSAAIEERIAARASSVGSGAPGR